MLRTNFLKAILKSRIFLLFAFVTASANASDPLIYMRPNETPLFTELYQRYGLLNPPAVHVFDSSVYLGQPGEKSLLIPSSVAFFNEVEQTLRAYHERIGNKELFLDPRETQYAFCPSNGSLQIIFALVYAIAATEPQKHFLFVEKIPFYSFHEHAVTFRPYPNARFQGFNDPSEVKPKPDETVIEFVTSPNNPDGTFRKPYTQANIIIADLVFSSPSYGSDGTGYIKDNIAWLSKARNEGKHVLAFNSVSKALGKPGYRLGYMWFPMSDSYAASIFHNFFSYTWKLTTGESTPGVAEALNLMSALVALPDAGQALRTDAFNTIVKRHNIVKTEMLKRYPGTEVTSIPGSPTFFAKLNSPDSAKMTGEEVLLKDINVAVDNGNAMGASDAFIRINLCGYSGDLAEFLNRLAQTKKYNANELLVSSAHHCKHRTIHSSENIQYVASLDDCIIDVDAKDANVEILLPQFINYQQSNLISIKKIDSSNHSVSVKANQLTKSLKGQNEQLQMQWTQPFFMNGQWKITHS
ncbi:aminotransferase class I/II-fold pyridoxal phosphate-dependent enzyme [Legionella resiliens]|uniref:Aminotransferase class I/II-fold pyridoxal phosphate-dependent enzyme n=1 Tax=Legionella resiliens TaxID=2905958 RepID=A0ABS8X1U0_9GAMM|nr:MULTISPECIES: aminotransferase class I/II-fold pyridoxal phosphate-dependent enzyme [unclassified Legionella]MCE0722578.1 aminotransferase class I/II-fold pyridoxal phosphate-dependent enzyme [Legionella sp. 9fVS26]MCE3531731.1 aminotransferase class I/II-fold pyridoxal phosphate-dependent enzyme [Legionella sp. 8cVS16]